MCCKGCEQPQEIVPVEHTLSDLLKIGVQRGRISLFCQDLELAPSSIACCLFSCCERSKYLKDEKARARMEQKVDHDGKNSVLHRCFLFLKKARFRILDDETKRLSPRAGRHLSSAVFIFIDFFCCHFCICAIYCTKPLVSSQSGSLHRIQF